MFEKKKSVLLFLLPGLCMLLIFYIIPFFSGIGYSLTDGSYKNAFVGLQNYRDLWGNSMFLLGLKNTMELSLICAPLLWILSFLLASALASIKPFGGFFRSSVLLPYLTPSSAILLVWLVIFDYGGPVNRMLEAMGMERVMWLTSGALRLPVVLMFLWKNLGFCLIIFLAALQSIPQPLYEYAQLEGASRLRQEISITLPMISPTVFYLIITGFIGAFKQYSDAVALFGTDLNAAGMNTIVGYVYDMLYGNSGGYPSYASAAAILLFVIVLTITVINLLFSRKHTHY